MVIKGADRYVVGEVERFNQKNEMFKRVKWDTSVMHIPANFAKNMLLKKSKPGYTSEEVAFFEAGSALERVYAKGNLRGNNGLYAWDSPVEIERNPEALLLTGSDPAKMTRVVKKVARFYGASLVGIGELDRRWIYSRYCNISRPLDPTTGSADLEEGSVEVPEQYNYTIAIAMEMDYEAIKFSPTYIARAATGEGYSRMAYVTYLLAQFIRLIGYNAIPMGNDTACSIPVAIDAGLGELSRMGQLITPEYGPRVRLSKVFTDLPLIPDKPVDIGVWEFCRRCEKCAKYCPSQAINYGEPTTEIHSISNRKGLLRWPIDAGKCLSFWATNGSSCSNCIRVCPFNKPAGWTHNLVKRGVKRTPWLNPFFIRMDDLLGYGKKASNEHFWK